MISAFFPNAKLMKNLTQKQIRRLIPDILHRVIASFTLWLFNVAMEHHNSLMGKSSYSSSKK
jgi:type III secretion system FlhB-like substrate exporter